MSESVIEKSGIYKGLKYEVKALVQGWRCGYVTLPDCLKGYFYWDNHEIHDFEVHGGITFIKDGVIGFDCMHLDDGLDESIMSEKYKEFERLHPRSVWGTQMIRDSRFVEEECKKLIRQLVKLKTTYEKGFEAGKKTALQWLPIETAPKDEGSIVLGFDKADGVVSMILVRYLDGLVWERNFDEGRHYSNIEPTHWMPIPQAPEVK